MSQTNQTNATLRSEETSASRAELIAVYTTESEASAAVRTYNLYVTDGTGRVARFVRADAGVYQVFLDAPPAFVLVLKAAA